jgi:hydroxypyruvate reductase 2
VGMVIDVMRRVSAAERYVRRGLWPVQGDYPLGSKVSGKRVGIIGLGNIGSLIAKRLEAFGCVISYNSRNPKRSLPYTYYADVRALAADSDVLVVSCALNSETRHIVGGEVLDALGEGGVVVNVGRGANVDEAALVRALREGRIAGAGLDVFEGEPKVSPELREMENVVLTPHVAVWTAESRSDLRDHTVANLDAFFSGDPLLTPVMLP